MNTWRNNDTKLDLGNLPISIWIYILFIIIFLLYSFSVGQVIKCHEARMINYIFMVVHTKITKVARIRTTVVNKMLTCVWKVRNLCQSNTDTFDYGTLKLFMPNLLFMLGKIRWRHKICYFFAERKTWIIIPNKAGNRSCRQLPIDKFTIMRKLSNWKFAGHEK